MTELAVSTQKLRRSFVCLENFVNIQALPPILIVPLLIVIGGSTGDGMIGCSSGRGVGDDGNIMIVAVVVGDCDDIDVENDGTNDGNDDMAFVGVEDCIEDGVSDKNGNGAIDGLSVIIEVLHCDDRFSPLSTYNRTIE